MRLTLVVVALSAAAALLLPAAVAAAAAGQRSGHSATAGHERRRWSPVTADGVPETVTKHAPLPRPNTSRPAPLNQLIASTDSPRLTTATRDRGPATIAPPTPISTKVIPKRKTLAAVAATAATVTAGNATATRSVRLLNATAIEAIAPEPDYLLRRVYFINHTFHCVQQSEVCGAVAIERAGAPEECWVYWRTVDGTAKAGVDYLETTGVVRWQTGHKEAVYIAIPLEARARNRSTNATRGSTSPVGKRATEDLWFRLELFHPRRAELGRPAAARVFLIPTAPLAAPTVRPPAVAVASVAPRTSLLRPTLLAAADNRRWASRGDTDDDDDDDDDDEVDDGDDTRVKAVAVPSKAVSVKGGAISQVTTSAPAAPRVATSTGASASGRSSSSNAKSGGSTTGATNANANANANTNANAYADKLRPPTVVPIVIPVKTGTATAGSVSPVPIPSVPIRPVVSTSTGAAASAIVRPSSVTGSSPVSAVSNSAAAAVAEAAARAGRVAEALSRTNSVAAEAASNNPGADVVRSMSDAADAAQSALSSPTVIAIVVVSIVVLLLIGGYVWYRLKRSGSGSTTGTGSGDGACGWCGTAAAAVSESTALLECCRYARCNCLCGCIECCQLYCGTEALPQRKSGSGAGALAITVAAKSRTAGTSAGKLTVITSPVAAVATASDRDRERDRNRPPPLPLPLAPGTVATRSVAPSPSATYPVVRLSPSRSAAAAANANAHSYAAAAQQSQIASAPPAAAAMHMHRDRDR